MTVASRRGAARAIAACVALGAAGLGSACDATFSVPRQDPTIEGRIVAVADLSGPLDEKSIHVKSVPVESDPCGIVFRVTRGTRIGRRSGGTLLDGDPGDLRLDGYVRVWAFGGVAESCPGQAGADVIEVDEDVDVAHDAGRCDGGPCGAGLPRRARDVRRSGGRG